MSWNTHIPKFRRFVLQNFPFIEEDFDALTDYQLICKVVEYLNKVIDSQNGLITETEELAAQFTELKSFVDNYFDNLDVQEEINNKLEEMAEDGSLMEIVGQYLNSTAVWGYDTVSDMIAGDNLINGSFAETLGYYAKNDGGGALYKISNEQNALSISLGDGLYANIVANDTINVKQLGAKGDGTTDDTAVIQKAIDNFNNIIIPVGTFAVSNINLTSAKNLKGTNKNKSVIKSIDNNYVTSIITTSNSARFITINNLSVNGNHSNNSAEINGITLISNNIDGYNYIYDVNVFSCSGTGIYCNYQRECRIDRCAVSSSKEGIRFDGQTTDSEISNSTVHSCSEHGIIVQAGANRFENTKVFYCGKVSTETAYNAQLSGWYILGKKCTLVNCQAQGCFGHGFEFKDNEAISCIGCYVDNNGVYEVNGEAQPLPDGQSPIYDGIYLNHVRRSYFEGYGDNFRTSSSKDTQAYTIYCVPDTNCGLNTLIASSINQKSGTIYSYGTDSTVIENGNEKTNAVSLDVTLKSGFKTSSDNPLRITKIGKIVNLTGTVSIDGSGDFSSSATEFINLPSGWDPTDRVFFEGDGVTNTWGVHVASLTCYANHGGARGIYIQNSTGTACHVARLNATWITS